METARVKHRIDKRRRIFTTGEAATICGVAPRTISKWFDSGKLKGYRIPGSEDRRIPRANLVRFLRDNGMPTHGLWEHIGVLLVGVSERLAKGLAEALVSEHIELRTVSLGVQAGLTLADSEPDLVVIDLSSGRTEGIEFAVYLQQREIGVILLAAEDNTEFPSLQAVALDVLQHPFDVKLLATCLTSRSCEMMG